MNFNIYLTGLFRTVHHAEARIEIITFHNLVGQNGHDFRGAVDFEIRITQTEAIRRRCRNRQNAPSRQIIGCFKTRGGVAIFVSFKFGIPIANKFKQRTHANFTAAIATGVGTFFLKALPPHKARQQTVVAQIQTIELVKAFIGIEIAGAVAQQCKNRLVKNNDRKFDRFVFVFEARLSMKGHRHLVARLINILVGFRGDDHFLIRIADRHCYIAHAEGWLAQINLAFTQWFFNARRNDDHREIEARHIIRLHFEFYNRC